MGKEKPAAKICKHCKTEIPYEAKVCPQCRKKQNGGILKWIIVGIVVLAVIGSATGGEDDNSSKTVGSMQETNTAAVKPEAQDKEGETEVITEAQKETSEENIIKVGESFENSGLKVTVDSYNPEYTEYSEYFEPNDGYKYIEVGFTYENVGDKGDKYVSIYDCDCYADNTSCEQAYIGDDNFINTNISAGRNVSFKVYYQVPISAESVELEYDTSFWSSKKVVIKLQ